MLIRIINRDDKVVAPSGREYDHKYVLTAEYRSDMYSEAFVRGMLESYEAAMDSLLKAKYISEVSVLSQNG